MKKVLALVLALSLVFVLVSCGKTLSGTYGTGELLGTGATYTFKGSNVTVTAKVLGFENLGKLEPGYLADIVLWDMHKPYWYPRHNKLSLLVYAANANDADTVLVAGKVVLKNGKLTNVDEEKIYAEACACVEDLLNK